MQGQPLFVIKIKCRVLYRQYVKACDINDDFRSVNEQIEYLLTECVRRRGRKDFAEKDE